MKASTPKGKFITLEGGEGAGKSTSRDVIAQLLQERQVPFIQTREPGGTPLSEALRALLLTNEGSAPSVETELLMIFAARAQHLHEVIEPALEQGLWVLCDRFTDATYAYQGFGRGFDMTSIATLEEMVQKGRQPDLTLLFDIDPRIGMERARRRAELDRFEKEELVFFQRVRAGYLKRAAEQPRFAIVDASAKIEDVQNHLSLIINQFVDNHSVNSPLIESPLVKSPLVKSPLVKSHLVDDHSHE